VTADDRDAQVAGGRVDLLRDCPPACRVVVGEKERVGEPPRVRAARGHVVAGDVDR